MTRLLTFTAIVTAAFGVIELVRDGLLHGDVHATFVALCLMLAGVVLAAVAEGLSLIRTVPPSA